MTNMMPTYLGVTEFDTGDKVLINMKNVEFIASNPTDADGTEIAFISGRMLYVRERREQIIDALFCCAHSDGE